MKTAFITLASAALPVALGSQLIKEVIIESMKHNQGDFIPTPDPQDRPDSVFGQPAACEGGFAKAGDVEYPCDNIDFLSFLAYKDMEITTRFHTQDAHSADIWGWLSPSGQEVTIFSMDNGVALVDSTDAENPCILAKLPTNLQVDIWADVKVYDNALYHVKDTRLSDTNITGTYGIEVYDLLAVDGLDCSAEDFEYLTLFPVYGTTEHGRSHNLVINGESARLYSVGTDSSAGCRGGMHVYDVSTPLVPVFLGCASDDGYTHDAQCVVYDGPDDKYTGSEICFAFNEDTLTVWDLTNMAAPVIVSRTFYENQAYSHQGWVNRDLTKLMLDDELDEICNDGQFVNTCNFFVASGLLGYTDTSTNIFDISSLENPVLESVYRHGTNSIDHNLYVWGAMYERGVGGNAPLEFIPDPNFAYLNNYMAGLRVLDIGSTDSNEWSLAGFFDVTPTADELEFFGVWSGYMHPSGVYAMSSIEDGLFLVRPSTSFSEEFPAGPEPGEPLVEAVIIGLILAAATAALLCVGLVLTLRKDGGQTGGPAEEVDEGSNVQHYTTEEEVKATV